MAFPDMRPNPPVDLLADRTVLITGAAHGIGLEYAWAVAAAGASTILVDVDMDGLRAAQDSLAADGYNAGAVRVDISDPDDVQQCVARCEADVDVLLNNAAMFASVPMSRAGFADISVDEWDRMMAVNLKGTWLMCRAFVPKMQQRGYGKVINVSSESVYRPMKSPIHYVSSKAGIIGFTRTLAREVGKDGVCVNAVAPGSTLSEADQTEDVVRFRAAAVGDRAIPRIQMPSDVVGAVLFFASSTSDFITGQTLLVDGGTSMN